MLIIKKDYEENYITSCFSPKKNKITKLLKPKELRQRFARCNYQYKTSTTIEFPIRVIYQLLQI